MKIKSITYYIVIILLAAGVILISKEFGAPGQRSAEDNSNTLPDHITEIVGATLPQAVLQSRQQNKGGVRVTDVLGNVIWVSTDDPTRTIFIISGVPEPEHTGIEFGFDALQQKIPDLQRAYELEYPGPKAVTFKLNVTNHSEVASLVYETSVELFNLQTTTKWVIDLTDEPGEYAPPAEEVASEAATE